MANWVQVWARVVAFLRGLGSASIHATGHGHDRVQIFAILTKVVQSYHISSSELFSKTFLLLLLLLLLLPPPPLHTPLLAVVAT